MKILKKDGTIEEGFPITDEQAEHKQHIEEVLHILLCQNSNHYGWQEMPKCRKVANSVITGARFLDALELLIPKPLLEPEPEITVQDAAVSASEPPVAVAQKGDIQ